MRKRMLLAGLVLLLAIPLVFLLREFARDVLLVELLRLIWTARMLFDSLPQALVWGVFLIMVLNVAARSLMARKRPVRRGQRTLEESVGQVQFLAMRIRSAERSEYYSSNLARYLGKLTAAVLAHNQGTTPSRTAWKVRSGRFEAPAEVHSYLQSARTTESFETTGFRARLRQYFSLDPQPRRADPPLERVVQFLEEKLEE
jgi:hypothetical protein